MRIFVFYMILVQLFSCKENVRSPLYVESSSSDISIFNDVVFYKKKPFTGILFEMYPQTNDTLMVQQHKKGLLEGVSRKWFPNHQLMEFRLYKFGRKNGKQLAYWDNGNKRFDFVAKDDAYEGEMKEWTIDGKLFHLAHYVNGQEEGIQKMWYENGKIRANYVILNGKRYGLLGTKNCKNVSDSIFNIN